jgi:hypothetical protein
MRKHIFGFALFSLIFVSFAVVFALFRTTPISTVREIKPPVIVTEEKNYCPKKTAEANAISHEIIGSSFFYDESRVVTTIRIWWNKTSPPPAKVYITTHFSEIGSVDGKGFGDEKILENPFAESNEKIVTVVSRVSNREAIDKNVNLYVFANVTDYADSMSYMKGGETVIAKEVLLVHGESSIIKK